MMGSEEGSPDATALLVEDRRTLEQLSSTALLAVGPLNEASCLRLAAFGLVEQDHEGYWHVKAAGHALVQRWVKPPC